MALPKTEDSCPIWQAHAVGLRSRSLVDALLEAAPEHYRDRIRSHLKTSWALAKAAKRRGARR